MRLAHGIIAVNRIILAAIHRVSIIHGMILYRNVNLIQSNQIDGCEKKKQNIQTFRWILGASWVRVQTNGERAVIDIIRSAVAVQAIHCQAAAIRAMAIAQTKRKHHRFHTQITSEKEPTPMIHIIRLRHDRAVYKILRISLQHACGQSHIYTVLDRQIQPN